MTLKKGAPRGVMVAVVVIIAALAIAACGSSSTTTTTAANAGSTGSSTTSTTGGTGAFAARRAKLEACLKQHGVTLPSGGFRRRSGAPGTGTAPTGTTPSGGFHPGAGGGFRGNPKDAAAFKACGADFGGGFGGGFAGGRAHFSTATLTKFEACVKAHGFTLPKANTSGTGGIFPKSVESNPKFQAASKACASILQAAFRGPGGAPPGGGSPGGSSTT